MKVYYEPLASNSSLVVYPPSGSGITITEPTVSVLSLIGSLTELNDFLDNGLNYAELAGDISMATDDQQTVPGLAGADVDLIQIIS